jgi:ubiquinone/menaquinone biosynthesis C-methylase UbiE
MAGSLPEMEGSWDAVFDESYLQTYVPFLTDERSHGEAEGAAALAGVEPGAEVLDCPCGFGRHALLLADAGYRVTGADRSSVQLAEARRRIGEREWPQLVQADYRELPFGDASFDAVLNLFTSLGYLEREGDVGVLREFRRVLRPGRALVVETTHRDRVVKIFAGHTWDELEDGTFFLQERELDPLLGLVATRHIALRPDGTRVERSFVHHLYAATEWRAMLLEAGFETVEAFGDWGGTEPPSTETRLILRAL